MCKMSIRTVTEAYNHIQTYNHMAEVNWTFPNKTNTVHLSFHVVRFPA